MSTISEGFHKIIFARWSTHIQSPWYPKTGTSAGIKPTQLVSVEGVFALRMTCARCKTSLHKVGIQKSAGAVSPPAAACGQQKIRVARLTLQITSSCLCAVARTWNESRSPLCCARTRHCRKMLVGQAITASIEAIPCARCRFSTECRSACMCWRRSTALDARNAFC